MSWIVTKILTYSWFAIELTLRLPAFMMKYHLPMLPHSKALKMATGMDMDFGKFLRLGERGFSMERLYNLREGFTAKDDTLPKRFTDEEQIPGNKKSKVPLNKMMPRYYQLRGWDINGVPTKKTLKRLDLEDVTS